MAEIIRAPKALNDLEALIAYISRDAPIAARRFAQKLLRRVEALEDQHLMGGVIREDQTKTYREVLQGNYRVIYRVAGEQVIIVAVHHAARLLDARDRN
jgi:addiction module RelE/StbE family toxin